MSSNERGMGASPLAAEAPDMHPLVRDRLLKQRTVFAPGHRIKMNVIPMFLNIFVPWGVFIFCCGLCSFWMMYTQPAFVGVLIGLLLLLWLGSLYAAFWARKHNPEPTWFTYVALTVGLAVISGTICGTYNFQELTKRYYEIQDLKVIHELDASMERGQNVMDSGIVYFANGNRLDPMKSWHFMHRTLYCVAPVVGNHSRPESAYDFWAVGQDCCSVSASDFRCGAWGRSGARGAIRILDDKALPFYRLAVEQAETLYNIVAPHPVFFAWSSDPLLEVASWNSLAYKNYLFMSAFAFVVLLFGVAVATYKFAYIGRGESVYDTDYYSEDGWKQSGYRRQVGHQERDYGSM